MPEEPEEVAAGAAEEVVDDAAGGDVLDEGRVALLDGVDGAALVEVLVAVEGGVGGGGGREEDEVVDELHLEGGLFLPLRVSGGCRREKESRQLVNAR